MKKASTILIAFVAAAAILSFKNKTATPFEPVAVIELFTSQGCSSCPSADRLLSQTIAAAKKDGRKIIALSFHVDYWNRLGWSDPFSDKKYSSRQSEYASMMNLHSVYTPQMIVNGTHEFVGSDENALNNALDLSSKTKAIANFKRLSAIASEGKPLHVQYELEGNFTGCKINFALISRYETTPVKRGENQGRILKNENVVRQFISVSALDSGQISFDSTPMPSSGNMAIVALVQRTSDLKIIGASLVQLD